MCAGISLGSSHHGGSLDKYEPGRAHQPYGMFNLPFRDGGGGGGGGGMSCR